MVLKICKNVCLPAMVIMMLASCVSTSGTKTTSAIKCSNRSAYGFMGDDRNRISTAHGTFTHDAGASPQSSYAMFIYSLFFTPHRWIHPSAEMYVSDKDGTIISYTLTRGIYRKTQATETASTVISALGLYGAPMRDAGGGSFNLESVAHLIKPHASINGPYKAGVDVVYFDRLDEKERRYYLWAIQQHPAQAYPVIFAYISPELTKIPSSTKGLAAQAMPSYACLWY